MIELAKPIQWRGIVACQRFPDKDKAVVVSPKSQIGGARAIKTEVNLGDVIHLFDDDEEFACAYAEFGGGHLQIYEKVPSPMFFKHPEQFIS